jgi:Sulfatase-modifying factor enzyme 1/Immunoglobulin domain/Putative Ig domain/Bacterial TSP3 repeat
VTDAPFITVDPVSQTKDYGSVVTLSVTATGSGPLNYQWYKGGDVIPGAVSSSLVFRAESSGDFKVIVTNAAGSDESALANLSVNTAVDTDGDGLTDKEEHDKGTDPTVVDTDGDGYPDGMEVVNGSNPLLKTSTPASKLFVAAVSGDATEKAMRFKAVAGGNFIPAGGSNTFITTQWASVYEMTNKEFASLLQYALVNFVGTDDEISIAVENNYYRVVYRSKTLCYLATPAVPGAATQVASDIDIFNGIGAPTTMGAVASFTVPVAKVNLPVSGVTWYAAYFASHVLNTLHGYTIKSTPATWGYNSAANGYFIPETQDWEWAARGGFAATAFATGATISKASANCDNPTTGNVKKVGSYKANSLGLFDLSGNVAEWVFNVDSGNATHRYLRGGGWDSAIPTIAIPLSPLSTDVSTSVSAADETRSASAGIRLFLRFDRSFSLPATDIPTGPEITTQPTPQFLIAGETLSLSVVATGPPTLTYQWLKNNVAIKGQTAASLNIANTTINHAGNYSVRITAQGQSLVSSVVNVAVATIPANIEERFVSAGSIISLTVPTAGSGLTYQWEYSDGFKMVNDYYINDVTAHTLKFGPLSVARDSGGYVCAITSSLTSRTVRSGFNIIVQEAPVVGVNIGSTTTPIWSITMPTNAIVGGSFSFAVPYQNLANRIPTSFTITGLPLGLTYNSKTGVISGKPRQSGSFKLTIKASNAAGSYNTVVTTLAVAPLPFGIDGTYVAAIPGDSRVGSIYGLSNDLGGRLDLTVNKNGTFTGRVTLGNTVHPFASALDVAIGSGNNPTGVLLVNRKGKSSIAISFTLNASTNLLECYSAELNPFTGNLLASSQRFTGWRNKYTTSVSAASYQGAHGFALDIPEVDQGRLWLPQGTGYGTLNITNLGKATVTGKLPDGTAFGTSAPLGPKGETLIYSSLYKASGVVIGTLAVGTDSLHTIALGSESLLWLKRDQGTASKDRIYPLGFIIPLSASGGLYLTPSTSSPVVMGITPGTGNAKLSFVGEDFDTGFSQLCDFSATNVVSFPTPLTEPRLSLLTLKVTPSTGAFTGSFTLTDGATKRALKYAGQIIPHPGFFGKGIGYGTYLIPALPESGQTLKTSPISARQVVLEPTP